jgi:hypothetical protein
MTENTMTGLLLKLADLGVTGLQVYYSGGGDSGAIESIMYTTDKLNEDTDLAFDYIEELNQWTNNGKNQGKDLNDLDTGLHTLIEDFAHDTILNDIEDWWNNDGGYGSVCILIPSGKYKIYNDIRITQVESYFHEGSLIQKTL